jgi:NADPH:quinone reductase
MTDYAMTVPAPGGPDAFQRREFEVSAPGPGEALVRHTAVGLNFLDAYHRSGFYPWPVERDLVPGSEAAGVVEKVGEGVTAVAPGDRVSYAFPLNAYRTRRTIPADRLVRIPEGVSDETAACAMIKGMTARYLIHDTFRAERGMTALVPAAAGGMGLTLGQWLSAKGVTAIGAAGGPEKCALAKAHGYAHVIDYDEGDFAPKVKELTGGEGVHVVYDGVGAATWRSSLASLRTRGVLVSFGQASGPIEGFAVKDLAPGSFSICRPTLFHYVGTRAELEANAADVFAALRSGTITLEVRRSWPLAEAAAAHRAMENRETTGASVLIP